MSYEIVKSISHRKKDNKIFITSASNNVWPKSFSKWEFMSDEFYDKKDVDNKELYLFHGIIGGSYQLSGSVSEDWKYAENKFYEYCQANNISISDLWNLPYSNERNIELLQPYYKVFKKYLDEKRTGKFYINSELGIITRVNQKSFNYTPYNIPSERYCKNYKKIYNDYCNISEENKKKFNMEIKEFVLENNKESTIRDNQENGISNIDG